MSENGQSKQLLILGYLIAGGVGIQSATGIGNGEQLRQLNQTAAEQTRVAELRGQLISSNQELHRAIELNREILKKKADKAEMKAHLKRQQDLVDKIIDILSDVAMTKDVDMKIQLLVDRINAISQRTLTTQ